MHKLPLIILLFSTLLLNACGGVRNSTEANQDEVRGSRSFQSLRLGQTDSPNSPVAVSIAIDTGEAIVVLNNQPGETNIAQVLYKTPDDEVVRITTDADGRPVRASTRDLDTSFTSNSDTTTIVSPTDTDSSITTNTEVSLETEVIQFLDEISRDSAFSRPPETTSVLQELLRRAIISVRSFGCAGQAFIQDSGSGAGIYSRVATSACSSFLLDALAVRLNDNTIDDLVTIEGLPEFQSCQHQNAEFTASLDRPENCILGVGGLLLTSVQNLSPTLGATVEEETVAPPMVDDIAGETGDGGNGSETGDGSGTGNGNGGGQTGGGQTGGGEEEVEPEPEGTPELPNPGLPSAPVPL